MKGGGFKDWLRLVLILFAVLSLIIAAGLLAGQLTPARSEPVVCLGPPWPPAGRPVVRLEPGDVRALAEVIYGESRGDGWCSQIATGWVVVNRLRKDPRTWGASVAQVIQKPNQFSSFGKLDPNLKRMKRADESEHAFYLATLAAMAVLAGAPDPTGGATYFYHRGMNPPPNWASRTVVTARIGSHIFSRAK